MKTRVIRRRTSGYVSYVIVLSFGLLLSLLMVAAYRNSQRAQDIQKDIQIRTDFVSKEDAIIRSVVAIVPNRAMRCMMTTSESNATTNAQLLWGTIFNDALDQANARNAIPSLVAGNLSLNTTYKGNTGDSTLTSVSTIFDPIEGDDTYTISGFSGTRYAASGLNHSLGTGFPAPLNTTDTGAGTTGDISTQAGDILYPIISSRKYYGTLSNGYSDVVVTSASTQFAKLKYPRINFGYAKPGDWFVAKRNWWAFSLNIYQNDYGTRIDQEKDYVVSIYEIPSQLSISSNAFTALGRFASGDAWQNVTIQGRVFAGKAQVEGGASLDALTSRRSMTLSSDSVIGGQSFGGNSPFTPGLREQFEIDNSTTGEFYPVSLPSESGRAVFVPINRGIEFFDRFGLSAESNTISKTTWNNYSVGALQCSMKLDVISVQSTTGPTGSQNPTQLRFTYKKNGLDVVKTLNPSDMLSAGGTAPFDMTPLSGSRPCIRVYPQLIPAYVQTTLSGDSVTTPNATYGTINNSLVVNVDYTVSTNIRKPAYPCLDNDIAVAMTNCTDMTAFTKGFSLVTNMRLYIGDDFNIVPSSGTTYPPASLYAPERRYGTDVDPWKVELGGQVGSLAADDKTTPIRPLDMKTSSGAMMAADKITVNLKPITDPANLPPIYMMNWLVMIEERRKEFF
ncbi:hypothetical protein KBB96_04570 [Luteolibacter ambystomatis]|uniref:Uncharacterized protein n=1 Tax=Luteolibacter ambystomatis TaxID=2824561 RepID=A0A975J185_9BACT|nr:hypothetical protein [Luteolibacter ambystomatis]QUE52168.1 hypothetical protein KBB96_04570 [Luteolibacter ambystomatis]